MASNPRVIDAIASHLNRFIYDGYMDKSSKSVSQTEKNNLQHMIGLIDDEK